LRLLPRGRVGEGRPPPRLGRVARPSLLLRLPPPRPLGPGARLLPRLAGARRLQRELLLALALERQRGRGLEVARRRLRARSLRGRRGLWRGRRRR